MSIAESLGPEPLTTAETLEGPSLSVESPVVVAGTASADGLVAVRPGEIVRKTLHMLPGFIPFGFALVPHPRVLPWESLDVVAFITIVLTMTYIAMKKIVGRPGERNFYSTCISYPATILATLYLFPQHPEFVCLVVVVLAFGDGSACIGGNLFGRRRLPWNPDKTWAGTISFIAVAAPLATLAYWLEANVSSLAYWGDGGPITVPVMMAASCGVTATLVAALAESWPTELTDNLRVGVAALVCVVAVHYGYAALFLS